MNSINLETIKPDTSLSLFARQLVEGFITGLHKSPYHGFSVEFAEHRLYNTGESTKNIDWKVYARTDRLYVKQYEEETNLRCQILLDCSASMYYPAASRDKIRFSAFAAAALAYMLQSQRDAVGLTTFSDQIIHQTPVKSTGSHLNKVWLHLDEIIKSTPEKKPSEVAQVLHEIAQKIHRRSLVIIFSDMFDASEDQEAIFKALQHLKHNKHEVLIFHVTDHQTELDFDFENRPHEFIDLESGAKVKIQPAQLKESFRTQQKKFYEDLRLRCGQLRIDLTQVNTSMDFNAVLNAFLIKRSRMK